jgi:membrane associated rhomboid family serine protease
MGPQRMYSLTTWVRRLLVANLLVFLIQKTLLVDPSYQTALAFAPFHAWEQPWTFVTYMFLHAGIPHLLFNMLALFVFGPSVEERMGGRVFLLYYVLCGIGGAALSFLLTQWVRVDQARCLGSQWPSPGIGPAIRYSCSRCRTPFQRDGW